MSTDKPTPSKEQIPRTLDDKVLALNQTTQQALSNLINLINNLPHLIKNFDTLAKVLGNPTEIAAKISYLCTIYVKLNALPIDPNQNFTTVCQQLNQLAENLLEKIYAELITPQTKQALNTQLNEFILNPDTLTVFLDNRPTENQTTIHTLRLTINLLHQLDVVRTLPKNNIPLLQLFTLGQKLELPKKHPEQYITPGALESTQHTLKAPQIIEAIKELFTHEQRAARIAQTTTTIQQDVSGYLAQTTGAQPTGAQPTESKQHPLDQINEFYTNIDTALTSTQPELELQKLLENPLLHDILEELLQRPLTPAELHSLEFLATSRQFHEEIRAANIEFTERVTTQFPKPNEIPTDLFFKKSPEEVQVIIAILTIQQLLQQGQDPKILASLLEQQSAVMNRMAATINKAGLNVQELQQKIDNPQTGILQKLEQAITSEEAYKTALDTLIRYIQDIQRNQDIPVEKVKIITSQFFQQNTQIDQEIIAKLINKISIQRTLTDCITTLQQEYAGIKTRLTNISHQITIALLITPLLELAINSQQQELKALFRNAKPLTTNPKQWLQTLVRIYTVLPQLYVLNRVSGSKPPEAVRKHLSGPLPTTFIGTAATGSFPVIPPTNEGLAITGEIDSTNIPPTSAHYLTTTAPTTTMAAINAATIAQISTERTETAIDRKMREFQEKEAAAAKKQLAGNPASTDASSQPEIVVVADSNSLPLRAASTDTPTVEATRDAIFAQRDKTDPNPLPQSRPTPVPSGPPTEELSIAIMQNLLRQITTHERAERAEPAELAEPESPTPDPHTAATVAEMPIITPADIAEYKKTD